VQTKLSGARALGAVLLKRKSGGAHTRGYRPAPSLAAARAGALIRRGMKGASVRFVQQHVHTIVDGLFGPMTEAAVKRFQHAHRLEVDGVVGRHTMAAFDHGGGAHAGGGAHHPRGGAHGGGGSHDDGGAPPTGSEEAIREQVLARARSHMGAPYSWAAQGPSMFDCSGFAWYVLHTDMHLTGAGRTTAEGLSHAPYTTPTSSPQKGDLVFYSSGGISHVTIALGSGSQVIGASGGGQNTHGHDPNARVKITDWSRDSRHKSFGSIRSLINRRAHA
jgi:peptidoglycan hydrolase-like protein with peptidoglycan-binding domain